MAKPKHSDAAEIEKLDLDPAAWPKFEKLVKAAAKQGPKPHASKPAPAATAKKRTPSA